MRFFCAACIFGIVVAAASFLVDFRNASSNADSAQTREFASKVETTLLPSSQNHSPSNDPDKEAADAVVAEVAAISSTTN